MVINEIDDWSCLECRDSFINVGGLCRKILDDTNVADREKEEWNNNLFEQR